MIELVVKNIQGSQVGKVSVDEASLGGPVNVKLLRKAVLMYQANQRQGTQSTLHRGEVSGSTRKLFRQKGTGHARMGDRRNPIRHGGGVIHGPQPRDHSYQIPKKALHKAMLNALLDKMQEGQVTVLDEIKLAEPKTRLMVALLKALGLAGKMLIVIGEYNAEVVRSARNIADVRIKSARELNAYDLLSARAVLMTRDALKNLAIGEGNEGPQ